ncbi:MAG TPA: GldG family protein [Candidatus Binatia bacterium]|nr:GldG family protein [Candidatus Binatia bacterium]
MSGHALRQWALLVVQVTLAVAFCTIALTLAERHNRRVDLTPTQAFVLSDQALKIAGKINQPTTIFGFYNSQEPGVRRQTEDLLEQFGAAAPQISFRLYDLDRSPALAKKYNISSYNTGAVESAERVVSLNSLDETEITNALLKLSARAQRTLCFLTGHGEHSPQGASERRGYSDVAKALEHENFAVRSIERLPPDGVPADCTVVVSPGPTKDLFPGEADQLTAYVQHGGKLFILIDPDCSQSVMELLARFNVKPGNDIIVDERNRFYGADSFMPRVPIFDEGTFRKNLETAAVFSLARTVEPVEEKRDGVIVSLIAMSSPESWARIGGDTAPADAKVRFRPTIDKNGPLPVAVIANVKGADDATTGRVAVFGDSDFASNFYVNLMGNKDLFMSTVAVLAEDAELVAVRRKGMMRGSISPISLTARQGRMIFWNAVIAQPGLLLLVGIAITVRRQRRGSA